jgi:hypothetical protein
LFAPEGKATERDVRKLEPLPGVRVSMKEVSSFKYGSDEDMAAGAIKMTFSVFARARCEQASKDVAMKPCESFILLRYCATTKESLR